MHQNVTLIFILSFLPTSMALASETDAFDRFIRLNEQGKSLNNFDKAPALAWPCVLDRKTGLVWEVKTQKPGLHYRHNTYRWFNPDIHKNGGLAGFPGGSNCQAQPCDTNSFIERVNKVGWCNAHDWRLPTREELRSLVDYRLHVKGPALNKMVFPNAANQFYWSADSNATKPDEAWGIGFAFGFDYAYYKNNRGHVRLVRQQKILANKGNFE